MDERDAHEIAEVTIEHAIGVEGVAALDAEERGVLVGGARGAIVGGIATHGDVVGTAFEDPTQLAEVLVEHRRTSHRRPQRVGGDRPYAAGDLRLADPRQIDLRVDARAEQPVTMAAIEAIATQPRPDERIDVEIDHLAREVDVDRLARDPELLRPRCRIAAMISKAQHGSNVSSRR